MEINYNIIIYITIAFILYSFLLEIAKPKQGAQKLVTIIFIIVIALIIGYIVWKYYNQQISSIAEKDTIDGEENMIDEENDDVNEDKISEYDDDEIDTQEIQYMHNGYDPLKTNFNIIDGCANNSQIKYDDFKLWYLTPEFISKYTEAVRKALKIKENALLQLKRKYTEDLKILKSKSNQREEFIIITNAEKTDESKIITETLKEVEMLLDEIKNKKRILNVETTRKGLISALTDKSNGIDSLTGRDDIKNFLALQLYTFAQNPKIFFSNFQNMAIYGPSGVGKTKLAKVIGHVYASSGILLKNHVHETTKQSFTTAYVNESAKLTRKVLLSNLEAVVFIDEAYDISPPPSLLGNGIDHGHEAITEMVNFIDKMKGLSIIIVAGYEKEMETRFMKANEGLPRRFPHKLILKPYNSVQLTDILIKFLLSTCPDIKFNKKNGDYLYTVVDYIYINIPNSFENQAGDMENLSGFISRAIYGTPGKTWKNNSEEIILSGINTFLSKKGIILEQTVN